jgi:sugar-specific transcriptional regulator TrmB
MNLEPVHNALESLGLKRSEIRLYIYLSRNGPQKCSDICKKLDLAKQQVYPSLRELREKNAASATPEHPAVFSAKPFEEILNLLRQSKINEAEKTQHDKEQIIQAWKLMLNNSNV